MENDKNINSCKNGHYFLFNTCPWCGEKATKQIPYTDGDCINCGMLCGLDLYCCYSEKPIIFDEHFICLNPEKAFKNNIIIDLQYPKLGFKNSINNCIMRLEVYKLLIKAANQLPDGYKFKIWDAWRPLVLQKELYAAYKTLIINKFNLLNRSKEEQQKIINQYIANPTDNPSHTTGGVIDITITNDKNEDLDMGTKFDEFTEKTNTLYPDLSNKVKSNRKLLSDILINAGFVNLSSEWWHYAYGDIMWADKTKNKVKFNHYFEEPLYIIDEAKFDLEIYE